ncbi:MAG: hypothetical protein IAA97_02890 [Spirochaetes bacterium]|uniref:Tetratricopeptide repeat protein n=1 Tax=Candidatus Ornithospirochaeta stercoripullorum TaxID=2840899 RepID=A0A9D9H5G7_9SPIO|nr:hypothetical protein [Candidatus Ornithospirochaeta stercoripullorum]
MKGKYRYVPGTILLCLALIGFITEQIPGWMSFLLLIASCIQMIYASRGTGIYNKAIKLINKGNMTEGVALMKKALIAGLSDSDAVVAAALVLQNDDAELAKETLERLTKASDGKIAGSALAYLSMYYWMQQDYSQAIALCEKAKANGYSSRNLQVNLLTYYLAAGKTKEFSALVDEIGTSGASSPAIVDFIAVREMLRGGWLQAGTYLQALCNEATPAFPDPYVHFAQVYLHYGDLEKAREALKKAEIKEYAKYSVYKREMVSEMLRIISDSKECVPFTQAANRDNKAIVKIANGQIPAYTPSEEEFLLPVIPGYPAEPDFSATLKQEESLDDEREISTDLTASDEEWLKKHHE